MHPKHVIRIVGVGLAVAFGMSLASWGGSWESKYDATGTNAPVNFAARPGKIIIKNLHAESDKPAALAKIYARSGAPEAVTTAPASGATTVAVDNADGHFADTDLVVYQHADGSILYTTITTPTSTTQVVLSDALTQAGSTKDILYELSQQGQYDVGAATVSYNGEAIFATPNNSPLRVLVDSGTNGYVAVTTATDR